MSTDTNQYSQVPLSEEIPICQVPTQDFVQPQDTEGYSQIPASEAAGQDKRQPEARQYSEIPASEAAGPDKAQPQPVERVRLGGSGAMFRNYLGTFAGCCFGRCPAVCCCAFMILLVLFVVPQNPIWQYGNEKIKYAIETEAASAMGVKVNIGAVRMGLLNSQVEIDDLLIPNPDGFVATPYFMHCSSIQTGVRWWNLVHSSFQLLQIPELTLDGLSVHIEQQFGVPSNYKTISTNFQNSPFGHLMKEHPGTRKYIVNRVKILDMRVHVQVSALPSASVDLPPLYVSGIGKEQHGVVLPRMFGLLVQALISTALQAKNDQLEGDVLNTLDPRRHDSLGTGTVRRLAAVIV